MLTAAYSSGKKKDVALSDAMVSGFDTGAANAKEMLTVTFTDGSIKKTVTYDISVVEKAITKFQLTEPDQKNYIEGKEDALNLAGGSLYLEYNDGTSETIGLEKTAVTGYSKDTVGIQTITVTYLNRSTTFKITVAAKKPLSAAIKTAPDKTEYIEGQSLDLAGGVVTVNYDNGKTADIDLSKCAVTGYDSSRIGSQDLTVTYTENGVSVKASMKVSVREKAVTGFSVLLNKKQYVEGRDLDLAGASLAVIYEDGSRGTVSLTADMISGYDKNSIGTQTLTITYRQKTAALDVTVIAKAIDHILVKTAPKTSYIIRETLDVTGGVITEVYNDESTKDIALTTAMCSGFDTSKIAATVRITVTDSGKTAAYTISVRDRSLAGINVSANPAKTEYIEGQSLDLTGGKLQLTYDNGETEIRDLSEAKCTADMNSAGAGKDVTVSFEGKTASFKININAKKPVAVAWAAEPAEADKSWKEGLEFKYAGKATVTYDNGKSETIDVTGDSFTAAGYSKDAIGIQKVTLGLNAAPSLTLSENITILKKELLRIEADPNKVNYMVGGSINTGDAVGIAVYDNGSREAIPLSQETVTAPDISSISLSSVEAGLPEKRTVTIEYEGKKVSYTIDVYPISYQITEGDKAQITLNQQAGQVFKSNADHGKFSKLKVDGKTVSEKDYDHSAGSTVITLHSDFINTLSVGTHTIDIVSADGKASGTFTVRAEQSRNTTWCVTYLDCKGNTVSVQWVPYGGAPVAPAGYHYPVISNVTAHQSVRPDSCRTDTRFLVPNTSDRG